MVLLYGFTHQHHCGWCRAELYGGKMRIGCIGTGAITVALVTGLCSAEQVVESIWVSPRNREKSRMLRERFSLVEIGRNNQEVVDNSDVVILAFLPKDLAPIVKSLRLRDEQLVVNLLSGTRNSHVAVLLNSESEVVRAVPLPCVAERKGPIVVYPDNRKSNTLFGALGTVISVSREEELEHLSVITALMAPYFELLGCITDWATEAGVKQKQAADYIGSMFEALSVLAQKSPTGNLHQLADESMTPGGLNELARIMIKQYGGFRNLHPVLQTVASRVTAESCHDRDSCSG